MADQEHEFERFDELREATSSASIDLLLTDARLGLTFITVAETATSDEGRERNIGNARKAHDWVCSKRPAFVLTDSQNRDLDSMLRELKSRLEALGQKF